MIFSHYVTKVCGGKMNLKNNENKVRVQFNIVGILTLIFIVLKITGNITWSWWWVFSPILISWGIVIVLLILTMFGLGAITYLYSSASTQKRK